MTDRDFRTPAEELRRLQQEVAETKAVLKDILGRLNQIQRHVSRLSPRPKKGDVTGDTATEIAVAPSSLTASEALQVFDGLAQTWRQLGAEAVEDQLAKFPLPELVVLAKELGLPTGKPSKRGITQKILGRVKESVLLSKNVNVTRPSSGEVGGQTKSR